jgi:hypothetical protein
VLFSLLFRVLRVAELFLQQKQKKAMTQLRFRSVWTTVTLISAVFLLSCDQRARSKDEIARDQARHYLRTELGSDSAEYEELSWGTIEPRRLEFNESKMYRRYSDSVLRMEERVTRLNDSIGQVKDTQATVYNELNSRRTIYQQDLERYRQQEADLRLQYDQHPEYDGYWLQHEYRVKNKPMRVRILLGDTVKYTPSGLIYR